MTTIKLRTLVQNWAEEQAESDLRFSGDGALAKLPLTNEQRQQVRQGLIQYARTAASRTVGALKLHNHLRDVE